MKRFIQTIKNIFEIKELKERILYTLFFIAIFRLGASIALPGIDTLSLTKYLENAKNAGGANNILNVLDAFSGGAFQNVSVFGLGIMPYITASIIIQLLTFAVPSFQKMQKEGDSGRKKINQYTRFLTIGVAILQ